MIGLRAAAKPAVRLPGGALPDDRPRRGRVVTEVALLAALCALAAVVALAAAAPGSALDPAAVPVVPAWIRGPLASLSISLSQAHELLLVAGMALCYAGLLALGATLGAARVFTAVVALNVLMAVTTPLLSSDVFSYIDYGRLGAIHGLDPYVATPSSVPTDPFFQLSGWQHTSSAYGPLFTWLSYLLVQFGPSGALWSFKALAGMLSVGCVGLIWVLARQLGRPAGFAIAAFGLNPIVLVWVAGGAHNDLLMLVLLLAGATLAGREAGAGVAVTASAMVKATAGLALPFIALAAPRRWRVIAGAAVAAAALTAIAYASFPGIGTHLARTLTQGQFENAYSIPAGIASLFGIPIGHGYRALLYVIFGLTVVWQLRAVWRGADWVGACGWAFVALVATSLRSPIWYPVWPLAFAALARDRRLLVATLALNAYFVVVSLPVLVNWP